MAIYQCLICGEHFPIEIDGAVRDAGFFTTRWVHAENEDEAEEKAIELIFADPDLQFPDDAPGLENAIVFVDEIEVVEEIDGDETITFFPMEEAPS